MLVKLEVNENRLFATNGDSSEYNTEDFLWTSVCNTGQPCGGSPVSMRHYPSPCETPTDLEFLSETNKDYVELGVNETLDSKRRNTLQEMCNNKEIKYIDMDDCYTQVRANRPSDDVEAVFDEITGETKVKLWAHEYSIDTKCQLIAEMGFQDDKAGAISQDTEKILLTGDVRHNESIPQHGNWKTGEWFLTRTESLDKLHSQQLSECRIKTEPEAKYSATRDSLFGDKMPNNAHSTNMKSLCVSHPVQADQDYRSTSRILTAELGTEPYRHRQKTEMGLTDCKQSQCHDQNFDSKASQEQWLRYMTISTNEKEFSHQQDSIQNENQSFERTVFEISACAGSCPTRSALLSNYNHISYNHVWEQKECILNSQSKTGHLSSSNEQTSQYSDFSRVSPVDATYTEITDYDESSSQMLINQRKLQHTDTNECRRKKKLKRGCRLWEYIRNLLLDPYTNPSLIKWEDRDEGTFKLVENKKIAYNWGMKRGNADMSYEKLSRAMRYYYKKKIFQPVIGKRLVYKFGPSATGWKNDT